MIKKVSFFTLAMFLNSNIAYSFFGQEGVPMEEYYKAGQHQTGIANVKYMAFVNGDLVMGTLTANLVDVGIDDLEGRLLICCGHGIKSLKDLKNISVRFVDENNNGFSAKVQDLFVHDKYIQKDNSYHNREHDISLILLEEKVDIKKFKPLALNLSKENKNFSGKKVRVFGFSPINGRGNSNVAIEEQIPLRRGMETILDVVPDHSLVFNTILYPYHGLIIIDRVTEKGGYSSENALKKQQIEKELEALDSQYLEAEKKGDKQFMEKEYTTKYLVLKSNMRNLPEIVSRPPLSQVIHCKEDFRDKIALLPDTNDLDKKQLFEMWDSFSSDGGQLKKLVKLGNYSINLYKPLPRVSAKTYEGDSGGAWIVDNEIVGVTSAGYHHEYNQLEMINVEVPSPFKDASGYFSNIESKITNHKSSTLLKSGEIFPASFVTSIWANKDWIQSTLKKILLSSMGSIEISHPEKTVLLNEEEAKLRKQQIEKELEVLDSQYLKAEKEGNKEFMEKEYSNKYVSLKSDMRKLPHTVVHPRLFQIIPGHDGFKEKITSLYGADGLDKQELLHKWEEFRKSKKKKESIKMGDYSITFMDYHRE